jgi:hypothetical protein
MSMFAHNTSDFLPNITKRDSMSVKLARCTAISIGIILFIHSHSSSLDWLVPYYIENNTWVHGNTKFILSVEHDISRVSAANK